MNGLGQMGVLIAELDGKIYKNTAPGEIFAVGEIVVPIVFQYFYYLIYRSRDFFESLQVAYSPDFSSLIETCKKEVLFILEMIIEPALGGAYGINDVDR